MRGTTVAFAFALGLAFASGGAAAVTSLTTSVDTYIGRIADGYRMSLPIEEWYINQLIRLETRTPTPIRTPTNEPYNCPQRDRGSCTEIYSRDLTLPSSVLPVAVLAGARRGTGNTGITMTGFSYILAKYGPGAGASHVWYVPGLTGNDTISIPARLGVYRLDHYTTFAVPDGGMTLMLLGSALIGVEMLRRRLCLNTRGPE